MVSTHVTGGYYAQVLITFHERNWYSIFRDHQNGEKSGVQSVRNKRCCKLYGEKEKTRWTIWGKIKNRISKRSIVKLFFITRHGELFNKHLLCEKVLSRPSINKDLQDLFFNYITKHIQRQMLSHTHVYTGSCMQQSTSHIKWKLRRTNPMLLLSSSFTTAGSSFVSMFHSQGISICI